MPGIPINQLATLDQPLLNNGDGTFFPLVYTNGITYKGTINDIFYAGAVTTDVIFDSAVTAAKINTGAVINSKMATDSITTNNIADGNVTTIKLDSTVGSEAVISSVIRNDAVTTAKLDSTVGSEAVTTAVVRDSAITTAKLDKTLFNQAVSTDTIRNNAITTDKLNSTVGSEAVTTAVVRNNTITPAKISVLNDSISINDTNLLISNGIAFNSVTPTGDIAVSNAGNLTINPSAVTSSEIATDAVITDKILDNAVTTDKILDGSVTPAKLANSSVGSDNICSGAVNTLQILDGAVTTPKIADNAVTTSKILAGSVDTASIGDSAVTTVKIEDNAVTRRKIPEATIGSCQIEDSAIIGTKLPDNVIDNNKIDNSCDYTVNGLDITSPNLGINSVDYKFPSSATDGRFLKHNSGGNLEWVLPTSFVPQAGAVVLNKVLPVGAILPYTSTTLPEDGNFLPCDGTERLGTDFPELSALISGTYGTASTSGKFKLPNLDGRVPIGNDTGNDGTDSCAFTIGGTGGKYNHQLNNSEIQHRHITGSFSKDSNDDWYPYIGSNSGILYDSFTYNSRWIAGEGNRTNYANVTPNSKAKQTQTMDLYDPQMVTAASHNNIQPYTVTKYIIKAKPDEVIQYNPTLSNGLSALNGAGDQTTTVDLSTTEIGLKVTSDLGYDGAGNLDIVNVDFAKLTLPSNFPVQTIQAVKRDTQQLYGPDLGVNGFEEISGLTKSIKRNNPGSAVRIQGTIYVSSNNANNSVAVRLLRGGTFLDGATGNTAGSRLRVTGVGSYPGAHAMDVISIDYIDRPDRNFTDGAILTYSVDARIYSGVTGWINRSYYDTNINDYSYRAISTLTLTELTP